VERVRGDGSENGGMEGVVETEAAEEQEGKGVIQEEADTVATEESEVAATTPTTMTKAKPNNSNKTKKSNAQAALDLQQGRVVDVVLSDMCAPFPGLEFSSWSNSVNRPYRRMMNTSGNPFRDHAGSIVSLALRSPFLSFPSQLHLRPFHRVSPKNTIT
jgi:21S rRNA (uridine2791-2'-O)-methyltransferase